MRLRPVPTVALQQRSRLGFCEYGEESRNLECLHQEWGAASTSRYGSPKRSIADAELVQELGSMYDYLAKIVLLGPSGAGK